MIRYIIHVKNTSENYEYLCQLFFDRHIEYCIDFMDDTIFYMLDLMEDELTYLLILLPVIQWYKYDEVLLTGYKFKELIGIDESSEVHNIS
jgi:hypothetical protein